MNIRAGTARLLRWGIGAVALLLVVFLALRAYDVQRGPALRPWHVHVPPEMDRAAMATADWDAWMAAEGRAFDDVRRAVTDRLDAADRVPANRYFADSPLNPANFSADWNRSIILTPESAPRGAAVLIHGMTDAPYSMRHLAELYRAQGWVAVVPRMPGHGTVPAGLTDATWEDWVAATRLAVRAARARAGQGAPLHLLGYSNGGALALKHALDAIEDPGLDAPQRVVLVSPMIGVTAFARFAGLAGLPALLPAFAGAAWLDLLPEFNPFKYNSFPVNAARQSYEVSTAVQEQTRRLAAAGRLDRLAPVLTFQSVVDATVSTQAVVTALYALLPANGSELVLFDMNRDAKLGPLVSPQAALAVERLLPAAPQRFRMTRITNAAPGSSAAVAHVTEAGATTTQEITLGLAWPREVFSLSHIALPFPVEDGLYGLAPDPADRFGINLGALAARGERGVLVTGLDTLLRISSNPFFPYLRDRVAEGIVMGGAAARANGTAGATLGRGAHDAAHPVAADAPRIR
ncbi:carboxylesterase [Roseomonas sp. AR75]|uniref:alpha/beta hydrolase n=1 Tax=Roseomonas sp. AR75 TaxID=2562311 RepID=UPI0010C071F6|nr:alpha/beta hydrolase [Roseomonas sp. AR75]